MSRMTIFSHANQINHFATCVPEPGKPGTPALTIVPGSNNNLNEDLIRLALKVGHDDSEGFRARIDRGEYDVKGL